MKYSRTKQILPSSVMKSHAVFSPELTHPLLGWRPPPGSQLVATSVIRLTVTVLFVKLHLFYLILATREVTVAIWICQREAAECLLCAVRMVIVT